MGSFSLYEGTGNGSGHILAKNVDGYWQVCELTNAARPNRNEGMVMLGQKV